MDNRAWKFRAKPYLPERRNSRTANSRCRPWLRSDGVERSRADAAGPLIEVAGILGKDRLHNHMANDDATYPVGVLSPETLRVALRPLTEFRVVVTRLLDS